MRNLNINTVAVAATLEVTDGSSVVSSAMLFWLGWVG